MQKSRTNFKTQKRALIMIKLTSLETRKAIKEMAKQGTKSRDIAIHLKISIWTVRKWRQRLEKGGQFTQQWVAQVKEVF